MTGPQLKTWRTSEGYSLREISEDLLASEVSGPTLSRWENSSEHIPQWVAERLLNSTKLTLPLGELHQLLDYCRATNRPFNDVLAQALREHLARTRTSFAASLNEQPGRATEPPPEQKPVSYKDAVKTTRKI